MLLNLIGTRSVGGQLILMISELVSPLNIRQFFVFGERTGIIYGTGTPNYNIYYHHQSPRRDTTFQLSQQPMWTQFSIVCDLHLKLACWIFLTVDFGWHERREEMLIILYRSRRQKNLRGTVTCCWMETYKRKEWDQWWINSIWKEVKGNAMTMLKKKKQNSQLESKEN